MVDIDKAHKPKKQNNVQRAREMYSQGYNVEKISKALNESPFLVAQWVKK